jgi:endonuclease III
MVFRPRIEPIMNDPPRLAALRKRLRRALPQPACELDHRDGWQLLVATILSAQSTDKTVNEVTPTLFARYPTPAALGEADPAEVEPLVRRTGYFRNKTRAIIGASAAIVKNHDGKVPRTLEAMCALPGVARKTANVVLGTAFRIPSGVVVDTHAGRVAARLALTAAEAPEGVETDLMALFPKRDWIDTGHRLVLHGRYVCQKRRPRCAYCPLNELCPSAAADPEGAWTTRADHEAAVVASRGAVPLEEKRA